jgi:AraC-like DNA-binding protein
MTSDTLSDVLRSVRLRSAVFYRVCCREPWAAESPPPREIASAVMPGSEHVIEYHVITRGGGWAAIAGANPVRLAEGDVVMFPQGDAHVLSSAPGLKAARREPAWVHATRDEPKPMPMSVHNGLARPGADAEADAVLLCGFIGCDLRPFNPLVASLPRLLHIPASPDRGWVAAMIAQAAAESEGAGAGRDALLARIGEMVFVDAVRRHAQLLPDPAGGWLAGLRDRQVGRALAALHGSPARPWSLEDLAREAGLSRSALHERFAQLVGQAPMQYLAQWRMQLAANLLRTSSATVATVALEVGYESEAAFARAFKRLVGQPPAAWRRAQGR